jgi:hypothetical protein
MSSFVRARADVGRRPTLTLRPTMASLLEGPWDAIRAATPTEWFVGRPSYRAERDQWTMYVIDPGQPPDMGARFREWTAAALTEVGVLRKMARCLRAISEGRTPR